MDKYFDKSSISRKIPALIESNYIYPNSLLFSQKLQLKSDMLDNTMERMYKDLYQEHPFVNQNEKEFASVQFHHVMVA
jgi:hypothetical protein